MVQANFSELPDFKEFFRLAGMTHVRTSPFYPQSNGKLEGREKQIFTERNQKLEAARETRKQKRLAEKQQSVQHQIHVDGKNINSLTQQGLFSISN